MTNREIASKIPQLEAIKKNKEVLAKLYKRIKKEYKEAKYLYDEVNWSEIYKGVAIGVHPQSNWGNRRRATMEVLGSRIFHEHTNYEPSVTVSEYLKDQFNPEYYVRVATRDAYGLLVELKFGDWDEAFAVAKEFIFEQSNLWLEQ